MKRRILYTEENCGLRTATTVMLESNGYKVHAFDRWEIALENYQRRVYDVCLFDESTSDGCHLTRTVRLLDPIQPIVVLTSYEDCPKKRVEAFSVGADIFLGKQDNETELLLRMKNLLRYCLRVESVVTYKYRIGSACFDYSNYCFQARPNGQIIRLAQKQRLLLKCLVEHANEGISKEHLIKEVWKGQPISRNLLAGHLAMLRKRLSFPEIDIVTSGEYITLNGGQVQLIRERSTPLKYAP